MLPKKHRLPVQFFYKKQGRVVKSNLFLVKVMKSDLPLSRFGAVVSSRVSKSAAKRNQIRRTIYGEIEEHELHLKPGKDVMITVLPGAREFGANELKKELKSQLKFLW